MSETVRGVHMIDLNNRSHKKHSIGEENKKNKESFFNSISKEGDRIDCITTGTLYALNKSNQ